MYKSMCLFAGIIISVFSELKAQGLNIVLNNKSDYKIVLNLNPDVDEVKAADILNNYLFQIASVRLPVIKSGETNIQNALIFSKQNSKNANLVSKNLQEDGFALISKKSSLYFIGGRDRGIKYAVYSFLEEYLNCRMYSPYNKVVPKTANVIIPDNLNQIQVPKLKHREYWYYGSFVPNEEFLLWHKLDSYKTDKDWGMFMAHSYRAYLPKNINLINSPGFFAQIKGKRDSSQLDYSNDSLIDIIIKDLKRKMQTSGQKVWVINPNDNEQFCQCSKCQSINSKEGTKMGSVLYMVNRIAAAFPNKEFTTVAYLSTQSPPRSLKPKKNVKIVLCNMGNVLNLPLTANGTSSVNEKFKNTIHAWKNITSNLLIWDYESLFKHIYVPFPNLYNMSKNIRYYSEKGVSGVFIESDGGLKSSFSEVKVYLAAKLMWDPGLDEKEIVAEFFRWHYGESAQVMLTYYNLLNENFLKSKKPLNCMSGVSDDWTNAGYLNPKMISTYRELLDKALMLSTNNKTIIDRINFEKMGLDYFEIELMKQNKGSLKSRNMQSKLNSFYEELKTQNIKVSNYFLTPIETYKKQTNNILNN